MAEDGGVKGRVDKLRRDVEYADEALVGLNNPDDFASRVTQKLNEGASTIDGIDCSDTLKQKYGDKMEGKVRDFLKGVDESNYQALSDQLVTDLDKIFEETETSCRVEDRKKKKLEEMSRDTESATEKAEAIPLFEINGENFDVSTPAGIVSAFDKLCATEQSVAETGKQMTDAFQDAYSKVEEANKYASEAGMVDYLKTWVPRTANNPHGASAQQAVESAKQAFSSKFAEFDRVKALVEDKSKSLLVTSEKLLQKVTKEAEALESEKAKASGVVPEISKQKEKAATQVDMLENAGENLQGDLKTVLEEYAKQIEELTKKLTELTAKRREIEVQKAQHEEERRKFLEEKVAKYESADPEQKTVLDNEERRLAEVSAGLDARLAQVDADILSVQSSIDSIKEKQFEAQEEYGKGIKEVDSEKEQVSEAEKQISDQEIDAQAAAELLDEAMSEKQIARKGMTEVTAGIKESSLQWYQNNEQMHETLLQQSTLLENVRIDEPKFFRNFLYNVPVIGKYGVLGGIGLVGKGISWLVGQAWTDNVEKGYQENIEMIKNIPVVGVLAGIFDGCKNIVSGLGQVVAHPEQTLDGLNLILNPWNWVTEGRQILDVGKAVIQYEEIFEKGNIQFGVGRIAPDVLLILATCGAGSAAEGASVTARIAGAFSKARAAATGGRILGRVAGVARGVGGAAAQVGKEALAVATQITWGVIKSPYSIARYGARLVKGLTCKMTAKEIAIFMRHGNKGLAERAVTLREEASVIRKQADALTDGKAGLSGDALAQAEKSQAALFEDVAAAERGAAYTEGILGKAGVPAESVYAIANKPSLFARAGQRFARLSDRVRDFRKSWVEKDLDWVNGEIERTKGLIPESEAGLAPKALEMINARKARLAKLEKVRAMKLDRLREFKLEPLRRQHAELLDMKKSLEGRTEPHVKDDMALVDAKIAEITAEMKKLGVDVEATAKAAAKAEAAAAEATAAEVAGKKGATLEILTEEGGVWKNAKGEVVDVVPQKIKVGSKGGDCFIDKTTGKQYVRNGDTLEELSESAPRTKVSEAATESMSAKEATAAAPKVEVTEDAIKAAKTDFDIPVLRDRLKTPFKRPKGSRLGVMGEYSDKIAEIEGWKAKLVDEISSATPERIPVLQERYMDLVNLEREFYAQATMEGVRSLVPRMRRGNIPEALRNLFNRNINAAAEGVFGREILGVIKDTDFVSTVFKNQDAFRGALRIVAKDWRFIPPDFQYVLVAKDMNIAQRVMTLCAIFPELYPMLKAMPHYAKAEVIAEHFKAAVEVASTPAKEVVEAPEVAEASAMAAK